MNPTTSPETSSLEHSQTRGLRSWGSGLFFLAFCCVLALLVFVAPWFFPSKTPVESVSWTYGFNNRVAVLGVGGMLAVMLGWHLLGGVLPGLFEAVRRGILALLSPETPTEPVDDGASRRLRVGCILLSLAVLAVVLAWFAYLPFAYFGESGYFIARLDWMVMGKAPYRDFVFNYGPMEVFLSYSIYWMGAGAISIEQAYGASLALHWLAGFYLIYYVLSQLPGRFSRLPIFCVIATSSANISLGLSYTPLRFLMGIASVLWLNRTVERALGQRFERTRIAVAAFVAPLVCFAVSPEMGIASLLACTAWFGVRWKDSRLRWGVLATLAALPAAAILFSKGYFESMLSFGGGGYSFPIYPTVFMLLFLCMVFAVSPALAFGALAPIPNASPSGANSTDVPQRGLAAALCLITGLPIVAALGRCDPGHIIFNGMGIGILFLAALSKARSRWFGLALAAYFLAFVIGSNLSTSSHYREAIERATGLRAALASGPARTSGGTSPEFNGLRYSKRLPVSPSYRKLFEFASIGAPLGCDEALERFLKMSGKLAFEYHMQPGMDVLNARQLERKLAGMEKLPVILVPEIVLQPMGGIDLNVLAKADSEYLSELMLFPIRLKPLNQPFDLTREIVGEIKRHYAPVCVVGTPPMTYTVLRRTQ